MTNEHPSPSDPRSARRRLLKGSFAMPAALTLASGTAFAAGSTAARCVANSASVTDPPPPVAASDTLIRVQAYAGGSGGNACVFVLGQDVDNKLGGSTGMLAVKDRLGVSLASGDFLCVVGQTKGSPTYVKNTVYADVTDNQVIPLALTSSYYAILVDASGNIVGISTVSTAVGGAVSNACWQSFGGML